MAGEDPDPAPEPNEDRLTRMERTYVRLSFLQAVLAVAGLFTGAVALYAALTESEAVRKQAQASVWPYAQVLVESSVGAEVPAFSLSLANSGVGPARFYETRVTLDGKTLTSWREVLAHVGTPDAPYSHGFSTGRVLRAGEEVVLFSTTDRDAVMALVDRSGAGGAEFLICYCSIYEDCWVRDGASPLATPEPVEACPSHGANRFLD